MIVMWGIHITISTTNKHKREKYMKKRKHTVIAIARRYILTEERRRKMKGKMFRTI